MLNKVILYILLIFLYHGSAAIGKNYSVEYKLILALKFNIPNNVVIDDYIKQNPPYGFKIKDLSPSGTCTLDGFHFVDETKYDGEIVWGKDTYWIIVPEKGDPIFAKYDPSRKLSYTDFQGSINKTGLATKYAIGLKVTLYSDGKEKVYENHNVKTKIMHKSPMIINNGTSLKDRCVLTGKKPLHFGSIVDYGQLKVNTSYHGPGVEQGSDGEQYFFDPQKAGEGLKTVFFTAKSIFPGNSCENTISANIMVAPGFDIEGKEEIKINTNDRPYKTQMQWIVNDSEQRDINYVWDPAVGLSDNKQLNPDVSLENDIIYKLVATIKGDDKTYDCVLNKSVVFRLISCIDAIKPVSNYITPNGDGINDAWVLDNIGLYDNVIVKIYNRTGDLIWSSKGYSNPWKGEYKNGEAIAGTYYYTIDTSINAINSKDKSCPTYYTGYVQVIK